VPCAARAKFDSATLRSGNAMHTRCLLKQPWGLAQPTITAAHEEAEPAAASSQAVYITWIVPKHEVKATHICGRNPAGMEQAGLAGACTGIALLVHLTYAAGAASAPAVTCQCSLPRTIVRCSPSVLR
jgi:hypothetical protein